MCHRKGTETIHLDWQCPRSGTDDVALWLMYVQTFETQGGKTLCGQGCAVVNSMCPLVWATRCPGTWWNTFLGVSGRAFLDEMNVWVGGLSSADDPSRHGGLIQSAKAWIDSKAERGEFVPSACLSSSRTAVCSRLRTRTRTRPSGLLGLQPPDSRCSSWTCQPPWSCGPIPCNRSLSVVCCFCVSGGPWPAAAGPPVISGWPTFLSPGSLQNHAGSFKKC